MLTASLMSAASNLPFETSLLSSHVNIMWNLISFGTSTMIRGPEAIRDSNIAYGIYYTLCAIIILKVNTRNNGPRAWTLPAHCIARHCLYAFAVNRWRPVQTEMHFNCIVRDWKLQVEFFFLSKWETTKGCLQECSCGLLCLGDRVAEKWARWTLTKDISELDAIVKAGTMI